MQPQGIRYTTRMDKRCWTIGKHHNSPTCRNAETAKGMDGQYFGTKALCGKNAENATVEDTQSQQNGQTIEQHVHSKTRIPIRARMRRLPPHRMVHQRRTSSRNKIQIHCLRRLRRTRIHHPTRMDQQWIERNGTSAKTKDAGGSSNRKDTH